MSMNSLTATLACEGHAQRLSETQYWRRFVPLQLPDSFQDRELIAGQEQRPSYSTIVQRPITPLIAPCAYVLTVSRTRPISAADLPSARFAALPRLSLQ